MRKPSASPLSATRLRSAFLFLTIASTASAQSTTTYVYPLEVSANGRYLVDQSAWIFATADPPRESPIIAKSSGSGWRLETSRDTGVTAFAIAVSPDGRGLTRRYSTALRGLNTWYPVAGVYDARARTLDIYVSGVRSNGVLRGTVPARQYGAGSVTIGGGPSGSSFRGRIDEVRLYDRALTGDEIQAAMSTPVRSRRTGAHVPLRWHRGGS